MSNQDLLARSLAAVWHPCTQMKQHEQFPLIPIDHAEGVWLVDCDGNRYLDGVSSWWVNLFGHNNPRIRAAIEAQLGKLEHVLLAGFTHEPVVALSERLSALTQHQLGHCFYGSDGASATEIALKMSAHYWRNEGHEHKTQFLALAGSYHGETMGALGVTDVALFRDAYAPLIRMSATIPAPDLRFPGTQERSLAALENHLQQHHQHLAAFIMEPLIQAASGMVFHQPEFLREASRLCEQYQVHFIADEIAVGFGRTGSFFAHQQAGITPDFLCLSKGITGGYLPLSVVMTRHSIYQAFYHDNTARGFLHSHSYTGNALACSAALAVLDIFAADDVINTNQQRLPALNRIAQPLQQHQAITHFRNRGMIWAFDVVGAAPDFARCFHQAALKREVLLRPVGHTVYFMPPYTISNDEFTRMVTATLGALNEVLS
jgi:adenosylmethionine---8-amino-7-oxononanoate aminotransferase